MVHTTILGLLRSTGESNGCHQASTLEGEVKQLTIGG
jgi:hypothetical protein